MNCFDAVQSEPVIVKTLSSIFVDFHDFHEISRLQALNSVMVLATYAAFCALSYERILFHLCDMELEEVLSH